MNTQKGIAPILLVLLLAVIALGALYFYNFKSSEFSTQTESTKPLSDVKSGEKASIPSSDEGKPVEEDKNPAYIHYEDSNISFIYNSEDICFKVGNSYLNEESKKHFHCPGISVSRVVIGMPDEQLDDLIYPGGSELRGKACFGYEERVTTHGYTVKYFENPEPSVIRYYDNCGMHPTQQNMELTGNVNLYFVIDVQNATYVTVEDTNGTTDTNEVWKLINTLKFK